MSNKDYEKLIDIIQYNTNLLRVFDALTKLNITDYYIGAGVISQTVWNHITKKEITFGISDIDIVIFDSDNLDKEFEVKLRNKLLSILGDFPFWLDIKNQAGVHLWYKDKFGYDIEPYTSLESAINTWPTTASSIGIRKCKTKWKIYAPFGIEDLMNLRVVANSRQINEEIYLKKQKKWQSKWIELVFEEWDDKIIPIKNCKVIEINR